MTHLKGPSIHFPGSCTAPNILAETVRPLEEAAAALRAMIRAIPGKKRKS